MMERDRRLTGHTRGQSVSFAARQATPRVTIPHRGTELTTAIDGNCCSSRVCDEQCLADGEDGLVHARLAGSFVPLCAKTLNIAVNGSIGHLEWPSWLRELKFKPMAQDYLCKPVTQEEQASFLHSEDVRRCLSCPTRPQGYQQHNGSVPLLAAS